MLAGRFYRGCASADSSVAQVGLYLARYGTNAALGARYVVLTCRERARCPEQRHAIAPLARVLNSTRPACSMASSSEENMAETSLRSVAVGMLAALLGAVAGHWLDLTTWQEQQHQEQMTRIYESTTDALATVVYAMDEVAVARRDSLNVASGQQRRAAREYGFGGRDSAVKAATARYTLARWEYNTKAPGLEALLGVYFSDDVRKEFGVINDIRLRRYDAVLTDSDTVAVNSEFEASRSAVEQFDHDMARLLRRGPSLDPLGYRIGVKYPSPHDQATKAR